jgi:hypothetical protein
MSAASKVPMRLPGSPPSFIENSGSMPRWKFGRLRNFSSRGSSSCSVERPTCTSRKTSALREAAHVATRSMSVSAMRRRYLPSRPAEPWATTAIRCSAGTTGVAGSASCHAFTSASSICIIESGWYSPSTPIRRESGLP